MANVVYLISSLPSLTFGQSPPISLENFHSEAQAQLSSNSYKKLQQLDLKDISKTDPGQLKRFVEASAQLHADAMEIRHAKNDQRTAAISALPRQVLEQNPLEREKSMMKWQWEQLTQIDSGETFTFTEVLVYKLKLQILHRLNSFSKTKGLEILDAVLAPAKNREGK